MKIKLQVKMGKGNEVEVWEEDGSVALKGVMALQVLSIEDADELSKALRSIRRQILRDVPAVDVEGNPTKPAKAGKVA